MLINVNFRVEGFSRADGSWCWRLLVYSGLSVRDDSSRIFPRGSLVLHNNDFFIVTNNDN